MAFAVVGALLTVAAALIVFRGRRATFDPSLVAVERFRNATREPRVDALIRDATDDIAASLIRTGVAKRVVRLDATRSWTRAVRHIAVRSVANTPPARPSIGVSGTITRQGDRVLVQVSIADYCRAGKTWAVAPVTVAMDSPAGSIDEVRRRTLGGVAALENAALESYIRVASPPPTFEAYEEFVEGSMLEARGDFPAALRHYGWAAALDTTFTFPLVTSALTSLMRSNAEPTDSLLRILSAVSNRLPPLQRRLLDYMLAVRAENWTAAHDAIRDAAQMAPERFSYRLAVGATHLNRPREAVEALSRHGMDSIFKDAIQSYWLVLTLSLHQLGEHRTELAAARRARRNRPQSASALAQEVRALAALGRVDAVESLLDSVLTLPRDGWFTPAEAFMAAGVELRAHGYPEAAAAAFARAIAWHKARPNDERSSDLRREQLAFALYAAGALDEADTVFRSLAAAHPDVPEYWGPVGTIAARRADRAAAEAIAERLSHIEHPAPAPGQEAIVWRARIAALLGDPDQSMRLLIDAFGNQGTAQLHGDMDFAGLASHPGFRDFVRPKG